MSKSKLCEGQVKHEYHQKCLQVTPLQPEKTPPKEKSQYKKIIQRKSALYGKEMTEYYDNDGVKVMLIPSKKMNYYPLTVNEQEFSGLQARAVVVTEQEKLRMQENSREALNRRALESAVRKNELKQMDKKGQTGLRRLSLLEKEARDKANFLLRRAWELRKEDEDDVKKANSLILQTKCQAIRDAQLIERKLIQKELKEEEKRIVQMMQDDRTRRLMEERKEMEEERARKLKYVKELNEQIQEIEARRVLEAELLDEEKRRANEAMFIVMLEELENLEKMREEKKKTREALNLANDQLKRAQAMEREEQRLSDLKIREYMQMKAEREEKLEREKAAEKRRREMEYARQKATQEAASDLRATQEEMSDVRKQEQYEREWRRQERQAAKKKQKVEEECRLAREQQIRDNVRFQAMEVARDKKEFERNIKIQMELQEKERLQFLRRKHEKEIYREQILKQINQKEKERIEERQEKFQEGIALRAEEAKKKSELREILAKKLESLHQNNVPQRYINEIHRQLNLTYRT